MAKKVFALLLVMAMLLSFAACGETPTQPTNPSTPTNPTNPTDPTDPTDSTDPTDPTNPTDPVDPWAAYECITIAEALALCENFVEAASTERYYIRATVKSIDNDTYGQMTIEDATGSIMVYGSSNADGSVRYDAMDSKPVAGDEVLLYGTLQNYKGNTKEVQNAWIIDFVSNGKTEEPSELPADGSELTIAELLALPYTSEEPTTQHYIVKATVESISNAAYGEMQITDGTGTIRVYNTKNADGSVGYADMEDKPYKGDTVTLKCTVHCFNGTMEIKQAYILEFAHAEVTIDPAEYTEMSIADARNTEVGTKVKVTGVVAQITYANGMKPSGVILVDESSSIYVYDRDLAARCAIGNTISIYASKTYWILEDEQNNAQKFGYKGCNQLESAHVIEIDDSVTEFPKSWITESTVKEILDTPASEDISTLIYKVTAQIKRADGTGFINYYINDLDGVTGNYTYTQCNGDDFAWLDEFDGKICTVYVMALNAKSSASGCEWRFLPIAVKDEVFDPSTVNFAENAVKYYVVDEFEDKYTGDPALELPTSVDNAVLGYTGVTVSYVSSDPSVISIDGNVMHCHKTGTVTITVTGEYNGVTYSETVTITVDIPEEEIQGATVAEAIDTAVGEIVTVKGIVGPSLVNRSGFYLIDETGVIAIITDADTLATLSIGNQIVLEGNRDKFHNNKGDHAGQAAITDSKVVTNAYGNHEYSTASFDGDITADAFYNLDITVDYTTSVFTMKATVLVEGDNYSSKIFLTDGNVKVRLYCSSANQYGFLKAFAGQEVTVEINPCNWNNKTYYTGCVLAVVHEDGTKTLNTLNFN